MDLKHLPLVSLRRHPGRTAALAALVGLLAAVIFGGSVVVWSLRSGLASMEARLGADLIVAPSTAKSTTDLEKILVEGTPGYFYMDKSNISRVAEREGVEMVSPQYFLASVKAGCCTMPVQIIGIDPDTDFTIQPWIARSYSDELGREDVVVGCNVTGAVGTTIQLYGITCTIVAKLDETGTSLDNAVFVTAETLADLIAGSEEQGLAVLSDQDPANVISTVQVKVADGTRVQDVADDINLHVRGVTAVAAKAMTSGVANSIAGVSHVVSILMGLIGGIGLAVLAIAFTVAGARRSQEYATLRCLGASRSDLIRNSAKESVLVSALGAFCGVAIATVVVVSFSGAFEAALGLPFLLPSVATLLAFAAATIALSVVIGVVASGVSVRKTVAVDAAQLLRGE